MPLLATTATANSRVTHDVAEQLGLHLAVQRGPLTRASVSLQNVRVGSQAERFAWLALRVPLLDRSGIVYTLTVLDSQRLAAWLRSQGIDAEPYHAGLDTAQRENLENRLLANDVKVLVATVALGMGFDKPDLGFVIHFQRPASVVHYYQQVGRAGRAVDHAYGVLLGGDEDDAIAEYFMRSAFPAPDAVEQLLDALRAVDAPIAVPALQQRLNLSAGQIKRTLKFLTLESPAPVQKTSSGYVLNPVHWEMPLARIGRVTDLRQREQERMNAYMDHQGCLMEFLASELDDLDAAPCGRCANCTGQGLPITAPLELVNAAIEFLDQWEYPVRPRKQWPAGIADPEMRGPIRSDLRAEEGRALCRWGDPGYGALVRQGKQQSGHFDDRLVDVAAGSIRRRWRPEPGPTWVTCVPSRRHQDLVPEFAQRLAARVGLPFVSCLTKTKDTAPQKTRANSVQQVGNLAGAFAVDAASVRPGPVLLVDDIVDSRWTFTVLAALLRRAGSGVVYPFALADSSSEDGE